MIAAAPKLKRNPIVAADLARIVESDLPWSAFASKTILISGVNGFLPAYMAETLLYLNEMNPAMNCRVIGLARSHERARRRFEHVWERSDFKIIIQDVTEPIDLTDKIDFIIHAASQASPKYYGADPVGTLAANSLGTHQLLALGAANHVEGFLFLSSGDVYGEVPDVQIPTPENYFSGFDPNQVRCCYGESKRMGETMCAAWRHQHGVPAKIVRPTHTYGPGLSLDDGRVFADFVANIVRRQDIVLKSDGTARRAFCYLADATRAFFTVLLKGESGQAYNVGNETCEVSVAELAKLLVDLFPEWNLTLRFAKDPLPAGYIPSKVSRGSLDTTKLRALGWQPSTSLAEGFRRTVISFEESL